MWENAYYLGIDIGTFSSKGVIVDHTGAIVCENSVPHGMENPQPKYYEHDAEAVWWHDFCYLSGSLLERSGIRADQIAAVGASTLGCDCLPVDEQCRPLRKAILYGIDARADKEIRYLTELYGDETVRRYFGRPIATGDIAAKILWIKNNEPEIYEKTSKFLTGASYIGAKLTGNYCIDRYLACASFQPMYDMNGEIRTDMCREICRPDQLAEAKTVTDSIGTITEEAASQTGLAAGTPVITGTGDSCAEAISSGVVRTGTAMLQFGSTLFLNLCTDRLIRDDRVKGTIFTIPGSYTVSAGTNTAGTLTNWYRDALHQDLLAVEKNGGRNAFEAMAEEAGKIAPGSGGLYTLPFFAGERSPINDPLAKGVIFGLNLSHSRAHLYRSALEGIGYCAARIMDVLREHEVFPSRIMAVGGGAKNLVWMQIIADMLGETLYIPEITVGASYGDALMAMIGAGALGGFRDLEKIIRIGREVYPDMENHREYRKHQEIFWALYESTKDLMHAGASDQN